MCNVLSCACQELPFKAAVYVEEAPSCGEDDFDNVAGHDIFAWHTLPIVKLAGFALSKPASLVLLGWL